PPRPADPVPRPGRLRDAGAPSGGPSGPAPAACCRAPRSPLSRAAEPAVARHGASWQARRVEPRGERREEARGGRVREALPAELDSLAPLLARAFERDPVYRWIVPDDARWQRVAPGLFRALLPLLASTGVVLTRRERARSA